VSPLPLAATLEEEEEDEAVLEFTELVLFSDIVKYPEILEK